MFWRQQNRINTTMIQHLIVLLALFVDVALGGVHGHSGGWNYDMGSDQGPSNWPGYCTSGKHQSPVNIETSDALVICDYKPLILSHHWDAITTDYTLVNTGHSLMVKSPTFSKNLVSGGGLSKVYQLEQFHFHWAEENGNGSEHTLGDLHYPMEMHMVAVQQGSTVTDEVNQSNNKSIESSTDGLAVVSVLFSLTTDESLVAPELKELVEIIHTHHQLLRESGEVEITKTDANFTLDVRHLVPHEAAFYRYDGSLTTPTCNEIVSWTLMAHQNYITQRILNIFRLVRDSDRHVIDNYRPTQRMNGREMYYYTPNCVKKTLSSVENFSNTVYPSTVTYVIVLIVISLIVTL